MNLNILRMIALAVAFASGAFAFKFYHIGFVKLEKTNSGMFIIENARIYELNELEVITKSPETSNNYGASQSYKLPGTK